MSQTKNLGLVGYIGADHVIDYTQEYFRKSEQRYDLIFDCFAEHSLAAWEARPESRRNIRRGWRTDERGRGRTSRPFDVHARVFTVDKAKAVYVSGKAVQRGLEYHQRADGDWKDKIRHR